MSRREVEPQAPLLEPAAPRLQLTAYSTPTVVGQARRGAEGPGARALQRLPKASSPSFLFGIPPPRPKFLRRNKRADKPKHPTYGD